MIVHYWNRDNYTACGRGPIEGYSYHHYAQHPVDKRKCNRDPLKTTCRTCQRTNDWKADAAKR